MKTSAEWIDDIKAKSEVRLAARRKRRIITVSLSSFAVCLAVAICAVKVLLPKNDDLVPSGSSSSGSLCSYREDEVINESELIIVGRITDKVKESTNRSEGIAPFAPDGISITEQKITDYSVDIESVLKGEYGESTIQVRIDEELRDKSSQYVVVEDDYDKYHPEIGSECILFLKFRKDSFVSPDGCYVFWCYTKTEDGSYANTVTCQPEMPETLDPDTLKNDIAAIQ